MQPAASTTYVASRIDRLAHHTAVKRAPPIALNSTS